MTKEERALIEERGKMAVAHEVATDVAYKATFAAFKEANVAYGAVYNDAYKAVMEAKDEVE